MADRARSVSKRPSPIHGFGLFADASIRKGEIILKIWGTVVSTDSMPDEVIRKGKWQGIEPGKAIIRRMMATKFSWINHANHANSFVHVDKENVSIAGRVSCSVIARRSIAPNEEITINYDHEPMDDRCRKLIDDEVHKKDEVFQRKGHYILRK